ncbi:hypothetical protein [Hylemonella gracilis]|nr:hypothetical protein [Hylemonella gracilis]
MSALPNDALLFAVSLPAQDKAGNAGSGSKVGFSEARRSPHMEGGEA